MSKILVGLDDGNAAPDALNDFALAKEVADVLDSHYGGYLWAVDINSGMINIRNLMLSAEMGYRLSVPLVYSASSLKQRVIHAGGEVLERFGMPRGRFDEARYAVLKLNFTGAPVFEL